MPHLPNRNKRSDELHTHKCRTAHKEMKEEVEEQHILNLVFNRECSPEMHEPRPGLSLLNFINRAIEMHGNYHQTTEGEMRPC